MIWDIHELIIYYYCKWILLYILSLIYVFLVENVFDGVDGKHIRKNNRTTLSIFVLHILPYLQKWPALEYELHFSPYIACDAQKHIEKMRRNIDAEKYVPYLP